MPLCECGCGEPTTISKGGPNRGKPNRYIYGHQAHAAWRDRGPAWEVDPETGCWSWLRGKNEHGYGTTYQEGRRWYAHRWNYRERHGWVPDILDHICLNVGCCNPDHLRPVTPAQSAQNRKPFGNRNGQSRFRGVSFVRGKWAARVCLDRRVHLLGRFDCEEDAGAAAAEFRAAHMPFSPEAALSGPEKPPDRHTAPQMTLDPEGA